MSIQTIHISVTAPTPTIQAVGSVYVAASLSAAAAIVSQSGTATATGASISAGSGKDQGAGNRYTLTFPAHPQGTDYQVTVLADGLLTGNPLGHSVTPHIINKTSTSVTYGLNSGNPGQPAHDFVAFDHDVIVTARQTVVTNII